jgi:hypothetical protein
MKKMFFSAVAFAVVAVSAVAVAPTTSEAVPAFARQTGAACLNCHFQAIPRLAAFGRNFRMNAFRDMGEQALIEDEHLSLPAVFNASFLMKARISTGSTKNGAGVVTARGGLIGTDGNGAGAASPTSSALVVQFPDESALLFGGRIGEHAGIFNEWDVIGGSMLGAKIAYVFDLDAGIVALALGTTDALGAASIFNDPSNAVSRNTRGVQTRARALRSTIMHDGTTALGVYGHLADSIYFAIGSSLGHAGGVGGGTGGTAAGNSGVDISMNPYIRAAYTGEIAGFDAVIGGWYSDMANINYKRTAGTGLGLGTNGVKNKRTEIGLDVQLQGDLGDLSVGFYMPVVLKSEYKVAGVVNKKVTGYFPLIQIASGPMGARLGYDYSKETGIAGVLTRKDTQVVLGAWYDVAQNLTLDLEYDAQKRTGVAGTVSKLNATTLQIEYVY